MNIHEHQAKEILKEFGAPISNGVVILSIDEINEKIKKLIKWNNAHSLEEGLIKTIKWFSKKENLIKYTNNSYNI